MKKILNEINNLNDLKKLKTNDLPQLCQEIRKQMIYRLSLTGGHVGSNLAVIEMTVALHYIFNSPIDKIVFDVSHQCYTHKLLTDRKNAYTDFKQFNSVSGFTNPNESVHDIFSIGHTSTAISLACGLAKGRDLEKDNYKVIAIVGDGSLSGGEAFEGLNNVSVINNQIIIIINDNDMSIAENHGGLYKNLKLLRQTKGNTECNFFKTLGFKYYYIDNGNDINEVINVLSKVKDINYPVIVHMHTKKGKGYFYAETNPEKWHYMNPFDIITGKLINEEITNETYEILTANYLADKMKKDHSVTVITAGTPKVLGFNEDLRNLFPKQFIDVGIAEGHAIAMASGIAEAGKKPVFGLSSTFLQRTYDQLSQDLALNNSSAVILVFFAGISQGSQTHMGIFDISLAINIPNIIYLAPTCKEEYLDMLEWGIEQNSYSVLIRVPGIETTSRKVELLPQYTHPAKFEIVTYGTTVAIIALGNFFELGKKITQKYKNEYGMQITLVNPRYISALDENLLQSLLNDGHRLVVTLEDGVLDGGFGEKVTRFYSNSNMKVLTFGAKKEFIDHITIEEQYKKYHLTVNQIIFDINKALK